MNMEIYFTEVSDTSGSITNDLLELFSKERQERAKNSVSILTESLVYTLNCWFDIEFVKNLIC